MDLEELIKTIVQLEQEREEIYQDDRVTPEEHPRLAFIAAELPRLWDLRRRLEAAKSVGLDKIPIPPPANPDELIG
jgi:Protein of unknown function (DUF2630)